MKNIPKEKKLILFDGICNLCNNFVQKIIKYDSKDSFVFASLQSKIGKERIKNFNIDISKIDSIILIDSSSVYYIKSSAVLKIMNNFGGFWKLTQICWIIPNRLRNLLYDYIAKNRYKWFGKKENCVVPTKKLQAKFIDF